MVLSNKSKL